MGSWRPSQGSCDVAVCRAAALAKLAKLHATWPSCMPQLPLALQLEAMQLAWLLPELLHVLSMYMQC